MRDGLDKSERPCRTSPSRWTLDPQSMQIRSHSLSRPCFKSVSQLHLRRLEAGYMSEVSTSPHLLHPRHERLPLLAWLPQRLTDQQRDYYLQNSAPSQLRGERRRKYNARLTDRVCNYSSCFPVTSLCLGSYQYNRISFLLATRLASSMDAADRTMVSSDSHGF